MAKFFKKGPLVIVGSIAGGLFVLYLLWYWAMDMFGGRQLGNGQAW